MEESITILFDQIPLGIITFSRNGDVEYVNQRLQQLSILYQFNTSWQNLNLFKQDIFTSSSLVREMRNVIAGNSFEKEVKQIDKLSGEYIYLTVKGSPYYEGENITRGIVIIEDNKVPSGITREYSFKSKFTEHLLDKNKQFIIVTDLRGDIKFSFGSESLSPKLNRKDITGKNIGEVFHASENQKILEAYDAAVRYRTTQNVNLQVLSGDSDVDISCTIEPFLTKKGLIELLYLIFTQAPDEKKISESFLEELIKSNFYHQISERREFAFLLIGNQGELICGYDQLEKILGLESKYSKVEYIGDIFPVLRPHEIQWINRRIQTGHSYEITAITRDSRFGNKPVNLIFTKTQESEVTIVVCIPIPQEINQAQSRNYKSSSDSYRIEQIADPICKIDNKGTILYANRAFKSRLMFSDIDLYEKNFFELFYTKTIANIKAELSTLAKGEIKTIQAKIIDGTNSELEANLSFKVENLIDEKPHTIYCFMGNIYDLEEERSHLNIYQSLFREASNGMAVESEEKIILANESFSELFGFTNSSDIEGKHILDFVSEEDVSKVSNFFLLKKTGRPAPDKIEFLARKLDGSSVHIEYNITVLRENDNTFFAIYALDITEKKREKRGMIESEQKYRNLTENINDFLYTFERIKEYFKPIFFTEAVSKITGYTQEEFLGDPKLFLKIIHPDDFKEVKDRTRQLLNNDLQTTNEMEFRIINKEANTVWVRNKVNVVRNDEGKILKIYGLVSDITLNKRAEEELKESAANLKKLNDAKDRFLSIISHDLRTPFSSILGFTDLLLEDDSLTNSERKQYISYIQDSSKSMLSLVNSLLEWTRLQTGRIKFEPTKINAKEIIDHSISIVSGSAIKKGVEIQNLVDDSYYIFADKNLILQVFNNLLSNAVKFTKRGDGITINVRSYPSSRYLKFSVKDTGTGIKPENLDKLFNIDTKFTSEGTAGERGSGLGLSLVKEIIDKHGGSIEVSSEYIKGSEFIFTLPVASAKILLVDNNKRDRLLYSKILMNIAVDYAVDTVSNGNEALERISTSPPALIITEHQMPVMNGYHLIRELIKKGLKSTIPVIVLSTKIERSVVQEYAELGIEHIFTKPVNLRNFKEAIEKSIKKGKIGGNSTR